MQILIHDFIFLLTKYLGDKQDRLPYEHFIVEETRSTALKVFFILGKNLSHMRNKWPNGLLTPSPELYHIPTCLPTFVLKKSVK